MTRPIHIWIYSRTDFGGRVACGAALKMEDGRLGDDVWRAGFDAGHRAHWCPDCVKAMQAEVSA